MLMYADCFIAFLHEPVCVNLFARGGIRGVVYFADSLTPERTKTSSNYLVASSERYKNIFSMQANQVHYWLFLCIGYFVPLSSL